MLQRVDTSYVLAGALVLLSALGYAAIQRHWRRRRVVTFTQPTRWRKVGKIAALKIFPVKSCMGISVSCAECTGLGLRVNGVQDRTFLVTDDNYKFFTQRVKPQMALIKVDVKDNRLHLSAPSSTTLEVPVPSTLESQIGLKTVRCRVWEDVIDNAIDCGDEAAKWLSTYILNEDSGCRLVYYPHSKQVRALTEKEKKIPTITFESKGAFSDAAAYLLTSEESLDALRKECDAVITQDNFRAPVVVKGAEPYAEGNWTWVKVGNNIFRRTIPCQRCILTTVDPRTGIKNKSREPLATLERLNHPVDPVLKKVYGSSPPFGIRMCLHSTDNDASGISVDDDVYVGEE